MALDVLLQFGIKNAATFPVDPVTFANTEFAPICARFPSVTPFVVDWKA
jgi:hypothetical protein